MKTIRLRILFDKPRAIELKYYRCRAEGKVSAYGSEISLALTDEGGSGAYFSCVEVKFIDESGGGFAFRPQDVSDECPIFSSALGVAVLGAEDFRTFPEVAASLKKRGLLTEIQRAQIGKEPALAKAKKLANHSCPTFLTIPGNDRLFEIGFRGYPIEEKQHMELYDTVIPRTNWDRLDFGGGAERAVYRYLMGRGMGCETKLRRFLAHGVYPVLCAVLDDGGIRYRAEYFADSQTSRPSENPGTHFLEADFHSAAHVLTDEDVRALGEIPKCSDFDKPVLRMRIEMRNVDGVSRYAYLRLPHVNTPVMAESCKLNQTYDPGSGIGRINGKAYMLASADGKPCAAIENAYLLPPKGKIAVDILLFFEPVEVSQATGAFADFSERRKIVLRDWRDILGTLADWKLPEKHIENALKAGYLQCYASCYGARGSGVYAPCIGVYSPIASESIPVVFSLASFGDAEFAKKCVNFFFAKQRESGFVQNMVNYMAETGGMLYLAGTVFSLTGDREWISSHRANLAAAVEYLGEWIGRNQDERRGGKGMIDGQIADPVDPFRSYFLNALAYAGLAAAADTLAAVGDGCAATAKRLAQELKANIQIAVKSARERAVLAPLSSGEWAPLLAPWAEDRTACCLHEDGAPCVTHATAISKDSLLAGSALAALGVFDPCGEFAREISDVQSDLFCQRLTAFSQPYYNLVPYLNLQNGNRSAFLTEYYTALAVMADRETYSFWEHTFLATPHKTHEQAQFLMRTRAMLYYERENTLVLFAGVPKAWLKAGSKIEMKRARCRFGTFSLRLTAYGDRAECEFEGDLDCPGGIRFELPGYAPQTKECPNHKMRITFR